jgi:hypothetical protein
MSSDAIDEQDAIDDAVAIDCSCLAHEPVEIAPQRTDRRCAAIPDCNAVRRCLHSAQVPVKDEQRSHRTSTARGGPIRVDSRSG